jgi:signal transduction histidine kinase
MEKSMMILPTQFAPAERSSTEELERQILYFDNAAVHLVADASPDITLVINSNRQVVFANHRLAEVLDMADPKAALGQRPGELLDCTHADEQPGGCGTSESCTNCGAVRAILHGLEGKPDVEECRLTQKPDNRALDLRVYSSPVQVGDEHYTFFTMIDISHEKRRYALERAFFHDILNTAGGLRGLVWMLAMTTKEDEIKDIYKDLDLLSSGLVEEINAHRQLLAAENNELVPQMEPLLSLEVLNAVTGAYQAQDLARGKLLHIAEDSINMEVFSDKTLLRRVIGNMTKNALEASEKGETVTLGCDLIEGCCNIRFWVHNSRSMPREAQLQVFQRSYSSKGAGRGLGTYSMKLLGERYLKGKVSFTSDAQNGTTFQIILPL